MSDHGPKRALRDAVCSLDNGEARLWWPEPLSKDDCQDMLDWLALIQRRLLRLKEGTTNA